MATSNEQMIEEIKQAIKDIEETVNVLEKMYSNLDMALEFQHKKLDSLREQLKTLGGEEDPEE